MLAVAIPTSLAKGIGSKFSLAKVVHHVCEIEIHFPAGATLGDFHNCRKKWLDVSSFEQTVESFKSEGSLLRTERRLMPSGLKMLYVFRDIQSHDRFVDTVHIADHVSLEQLSGFGFNFTRRHRIDFPAIMPIALS
ncbi:hypothetical protein BH10BDE1_BH10BDE1_07880 [soil metagenome]